MIEYLRSQVDAMRTSRCRHPKAVDEKIVFLNCWECRCLLVNGKLLNAGEKYDAGPDAEFLSSYMTEDNV